METLDRSWKAVTMRWRVLGSVARPLAWDLFCEDAEDFASASSLMRLPMASYVKQ